MGDRKDYHVGQTVYLYAKKRAGYLHRNKDRVGKVTKVGKKYVYVDVSTDHVLTLIVKFDIATRKEVVEIGVSEYIIFPNIEEYEEEKERDGLVEILKSFVNARSYEEASIQCMRKIAEAIKEENKN